MASLIKKYKDEDDAEKAAGDKLNRMIAEQMMKYVAANPNAIVDILKRTGYKND